MNASNKILNSVRAKTLAIVYAAAVAAYVVYGWVSYAGLYRWFAEWQMAQFGYYNGRITLLVPLLALLLIGAGIGRVLGISVPFATRPASAPTRARPASGLGRGLAILGLAAIVVAAGAGALGYQKSMRANVSEVVDLSAHQVPQSTHLRLTAVARPGLLTQFRIKAGGFDQTDTFLPLTAADWKQGDPVVYFLKTNISAYLLPNGGGVIMLNRTTAPFAITEEGVLLRDDLPGPIAELYRKDGIALGAPVFVLDAINKAADVTIYWMVAAGGGVAGFFLLVTAAALAQRQRLLRRMA